MYNRTVPEQKASGMVAFEHGEAARRLSVYRGSGRKEGSRPEKDCVVALA